VKLFEHLIPNKNHPVWVSWVKHVEYVDMMLNKNSFSLAELVMLDMAVFEATKHFNKVREFTYYLLTSYFLLLTSYLLPLTFFLLPLTRSASTRASSNQNNILLRMLLSTSSEWGR